MMCPHCGEPVRVGGKGVTHYYVPKRPAHKDEPACPVCGGLDIPIVREREEEEARV